MRLVGDFNRTFDLPPEAEAEDTTMFQINAADSARTDMGWPPEVDLILSAMDAAYPRRTNDRRGSVRTSYRARAELKLFADHPLDAGTILYTRDVHERGIGFITQERLPLGYGGIVELTLDTGRRIRAHCTVYRCRQAINGWFEGALHFTAPQYFDA
jgi:hypothetical protein